MPVKHSIGVGAVGTRPGSEGGLLAELPVGPEFQFLAFSDEGLEQRAPEQRPVSYYSDYNMLLKDPRVELVLVEGPVEARRDAAVRALNAGRHVVVQRPFCETALGAERVMKTAFHNGLVATMDMRWREEGDLRALRRALEQENIGRVEGLEMFWHPREGEIPREGFLQACGVEVLDQIRTLVDRDVRDVSTHLLSRMPGGPDIGFFLYLSLREGGWATVQAGGQPKPSVPRWVVHTPGAAVVAQGGTAVVTAGDQRRSYGTPADPPDFWENLYAVIQGEGELKCHPVEIVRAMKLHEAAILSAETGKPETV